MEAIQTLGPLRTFVAPIIPMDMIASLSPRLETDLSTNDVYLLVFT